MSKKIYNKNFYKNLNESLESARIIAPLILKILKVKSVLDVGCGKGGFLRAFKEKGVEDIKGIEGEWVNNETTFIPKKYIMCHNLEKPLNINRKFDLVISTEVAEHLPRDLAEKFVDDLTTFGNAVLFSAAIPFQGGTNHINEQWPDYWAKLFLKRGYIPFDCIREKIWTNPNVSYCYAQNMILYLKKEQVKKNKLLNNELNATKEIGCLSKVHPKLYLIKAKRCEFFKKIVPPFIKRGIRKFIES